MINDKELEVTRVWLDDFWLDPEDALKDVKRVYMMVGCLFDEIQRLKEAAFKNEGDIDVHQID